MPGICFKYDDDKKTRLMSLCEHGKITLEIIREFKNSRKMRKQIGKKDKYGWTALMYLCRYNQNITPELIRELKDEIKMQSNKGLTALMCLCKNININIDLVKELKDEIGMIDNYYSTALIDYISDNPAKSLDLNVIKFLKSEMKLKNFNGTALMHLCIIRRKNQVIELIRELKDEIGMKDRDGYTALCHFCSRYPGYINIEIINELKDEINIENRYHEYPISCYCEYDKIDLKILQSLLINKDNMLAYRTLICKLLSQVESNYNVDNKYEIICFLKERLQD